MLCLVRHPDRKGARVTDVVENQYRTDDPAVPVVDGGSRIFDLGLYPVAADKHTMHVQAHDLVLLHRLLSQVARGLARCPFDDIEDFGERTAGCVLPCPAGHFLGNPIEIGDVPERIRGEYGISDGIERDLGALLLLEQSLLCILQ